MLVDILVLVTSISLVLGISLPSFKPQSLSFQERRGDTYVVYGGNGDVSDGWPAMRDWVSSFDTMFKNNQNIMQNSCTQWDVPNNNNDEISDIYTAIQSVAKSTGVDPRFILAIIMEESNGCVRAPTTNYGVQNPGLMQSHNGAGSCNSGTVQNPCPMSEITLMIRDGTAGTSSGDGLEQCLVKSGVSDVSMYYKAARIYNSGSIAISGNLGQGVATHCYASDIANRLTGWTAGDSLCNAIAVSELTSTPGNSSTRIAAAPTSATIQAAAVEGKLFFSHSTTNAIPSSTATGFIPAPTYFGAVSTCQGWYTVRTGDICLDLEQRFGITMTQLTSWNTGLDTSCSNLWLGYQYCVEV